MAISATITLYLAPVEEGWPTDRRERSAITSRDEAPHRLNVYFLRLASVYANITRYKYPEMKK